MNIIKNYIYNTLYQIMLLFVPLITMPYLTRIFTPSQMGLNTYTLSIVNYFMYFGMLGMQMYGNRQIAYVRDNKENLTKTFWSLFTTQLITASISTVAYFIFMFFYISDNIVIYLIQGLNMVSITIDISWIFMGLEDFKKVSIRNMIVKLAGLIGIFVFVKNSEDLVIYIFITVIVNIIGMLVMWVYLPKYVGRINIDFDIIKKTIIPLIMIFLPQIASQVYMLLSRTMIGVLSNTEQVAFYDYSQKIVRMILALITSIGTVLMPRVSNMTSNGKKEEVNNFVSKAFKLVSYISMPISIGLMAISNNLVSWFLGPEYLEVGKLATIGSVIIIAVSWANIIGVQYLIATKQENKYTISVVIAAVISCLINIFLIKKIGAYGAVISLIVAEFGGVIIQFIQVRKQLSISKMLKDSAKYLLVSIIMGIAIVPIGIMINNKILANIVQVLIGVFIYFGIMALIKDEIQKEIIKKGINLFENKFKYKKAELE